MPWVDDVTLTVDFKFKDGPFEDAALWNPLVSDVRAVSINRGRSSVRQAFNAGVATIVLDNSGGEYDPNNSGSTYAGDLNPGTRVRIRATYDATIYDLFMGFVSRWPVSYDPPNDSIVTIECQDALSIIRSANLTEQSYSQQSSDARIGDILDDVGWPAGWRNLNTGVSLVAAETFSGSAGGLIDRVVQAEQGAFFVDAAGDARFLARDEYFGRTARIAADFGDTALATDIMNPVFDYDYDQLINEAAVTGVTGDAQEASDATSIAAYGPTASGLSVISNVAILNESYALNVAEWIVAKYKDVRPRIREFTVVGQKQVTRWDDILSIDLASFRNVEFTPVNSDTYDQDLQITNIMHDIRPGVWVTKFGCWELSDIEQNHFWILGTGELGDAATVDTTTAIA